MTLDTSGGIPPIDVAGLRARGESTRARYPDRDGYVERDGVRTFYEVYGDGEPTILFLPTWSLVDSRVWKMQIAYFARHFRVLVFDGRGNGKSDRPQDPSLYTPDQFAADALAVMDATGTDRAVTVSLSAGTSWNLYLCAVHCDRVAGAVFAGPLFPVGPMPGWTTTRFHRVRQRYDGWERVNRHHITAQYADFVEWWARRCLSDQAHSERAVEETLGRALQTDARTALAALGGPAMLDAPNEDWCIADLFEGGMLEALAGQVRCPVLVIEGDRDVVTPPHWAQAIARATGGELVMIEGTGHLAPGREPVAFNAALRKFVERQRSKRDPVAHRSSSGRPRALFISSPIGLGHAQRDVAIARELRKLIPDLRVDWLAQDPVTRVLEAEGEHIHPASEHLASESGHCAAESSEHDLHCFQALRRMDEILCANFMVFDDVVRDGGYDVWIGDEAWELDYYLHENPGEKRAPYVWLTDFVGILPMPDDGPRGEFLAADWNEQMVEHVCAHPTVRDRSLFIGDPEDIIDAPLGPGLPTIRAWTEAHYDFVGYITGFDPSEFADRDTLRAELGYTQEKVCLVTVGGSGIGSALLRRVAEATSHARGAVPGLRVVLVAGPRIDPQSLPVAEGLEVRGYVHNLHRELAACDLAVVQGGLATTMELTAHRRPFIYFPLGHHFEQRFHVVHRLDRYGAGREMEFAESTPEAIGEAIAQELGRPVDYRPVESDGSRRAAERIAQLLDEHDRARAAG